MARGSRTTGQLGPGEGLLSLETTMHSQGEAKTCGARGESIAVGVSVEDMMSWLSDRCGRERGSERVSGRRR